MLLCAFLIGVVAGLRSLTAPAVVAWAAALGWIDLHGSHLSFMGSPTAVAAFTLAALGELFLDKQPWTPSRTTVIGLFPRVAFGALAGAAVAVAARQSQSVALGGVVGGLGGIVGAFAGFQARTRLVRGLKVPDIAIAVLEDVVAVGAGLLIVSRF